MSLIPFLALLPLAAAREIAFPPVSGYTTSDQVILGGYNNPDISQPKFAGLNTYANLPYVHCLAAEGEEVEKFDIAILGAPFDTVSLHFIFLIWFCGSGGWLVVKRKDVVVKHDFGCRVCSTPCLTSLSGNSDFDGCSHSVLQDAKVNDAIKACAVRGLRTAGHYFYILQGRDFVPGFAYDERCYCKGVLQASHTQAYRRGRWDLLIIGVWLFCATEAHNR